MAVTPGGSILCCGELIASSPKKPSNHLLMPPCSFSSRSVLPPKSPRKDQAVGVGKAWLSFLPNKRSCPVKY
ncbi:uncharacterized protein N7518_004901 [Penicillium psychrosexuale]|uniref:uncharacterized protein n=1 Tax=Penicillium psychrosexuale TaxID=1002107 RepID=UPI002545A8F0|nr:uncharacterized protein N7518_004901 [Penicillium psychrosexuale]KAJ5796361.1 hypothetical protein N7518_004901 [Penicillium psychrosexuale]